MSDHASRDELLGRFRTYEPPPADLDLHHADNERLVKHGLPRRPDPEREPHLARQWRVAFSRPTNFVRAELAIDEVMSARNPLARRTDAFGPQGWGGVVRERYYGSDFADRALMVMASWVVPEVSEIDPAGYDDLTVAFWVGMDGASEEQVLQAGVAATVNAGWFSNDVTYWAWTEWYTGKYQDPAVRVTNFPVRAGDHVFFVVCATEPDFGLVSMLNYTRGVASTVGIPARPDITSQGACVEWVVEGISADLPYFFPVLFNSCSGTTGTSFFEAEPHGSPTNIVGASGNELTRAYIGSSNQVLVEWTGWE